MGRPATVLTSLTTGRKSTVPPKSAAGMPPEPAGKMPALRNAAISGCGFGQHPCSPLLRGWYCRVAPLATLALVLFLASLSGGCVTKSEARRQAQRAYIAGRHEGEQAVLQRLQQGAEGPNVNFVGQVDKPVVPWWDGLTLYRAIANAGYYAPTAPKLILIHRGNSVIPVDPKLLLEGDDLDVQAGDIIELQQ